MFPTFSPELDSQMRLQKEKRILVSNFSLKIGGGRLEFCYFIHDQNKTNNQPSVEKLVDSADSKSASRKGVWVQVPPEGLIPK